MEKVEKAAVLHCSSLAVLQQELGLLLSCSVPSHLISQLLSHALSPCHDPWLSPVSGGWRGCGEMLQAARKGAASLSSASASLCAKTWNLLNSGQIRGHPQQGSWEPAWRSSGSKHYP